jgi:macrolide transport system ATP-binding/permease protein
MNWIKQLCLRRRFYSELSEEMRTHLEEKIEELVGLGMSKDEAEVAARRAFGNVTLMQADSREVWCWPSIESVFSDVCYAIRVLRKSPVFTCVAVVTLALGIAVNTAIFTAFDALVLRPPPVRDPDSLAVLFRTTPGEPHGRFSYPDYLYYRDHNRSFSELSLFAFGMGVTTSALPATGPETASHVAGAVGFRLPQFLQGSAQPIGCSFVSGNYFSMLGATPWLGRILLPEDDRPNSLPVVLMSGNFWQRQFHSDPGVVGSIIHLNGIAFTA